MKPDQTIDTSGLFCPAPVIKSKKALKTMLDGQILAVITTDPVARIDIPHMCNQFKHQLIRIDKDGPKDVFLVRKGI